MLRLHVDLERESPVRSQMKRLVIIDDPEIEAGTDDEIAIVIRDAMKCALPGWNVAAFWEVEQEVEHDRRATINPGSKRSHSMREGSVIASTRPPGNDDSLSFFFAGFGVVVAILAVAFIQGVCD